MRKNEVPLKRRVLAFGPAFFVMGVIWILGLSGRLILVKSEFVNFVLYWLLGMFAGLATAVVLCLLLGIPLRKVVK